VRERVDRRLREAGADAGYLDPGPGVGSTSLGRRERIFNGGAEELWDFHRGNPVACP
jgi:hypothetical protein